VQDLLQRVQERGEVALADVDADETLQAVQAAVMQLAEWHTALDAEDKIARMGRAVATGAADFLFEESVTEALTAAAVAGDTGSAMGGECAAAAVQDAKPIWLEMRVLHSTEAGNASQELWGGAAALEAGTGSADGGMPRHAAQRLQATLAGPLAARVAAWQGCGATGCEVTVERVDDAVVDLPDGVVDGMDTGDADTTAECVVRVQWCVDAPAVARAGGEAASSRARQAVADCMDAVVTAASDLLRCAAEPVA
jgi:hypothetical protein